MKTYLKGVAVQATAILLAALGAALIAFATSLADEMGIDCRPIGDPEEVGAMGGMIKAIHTAIIFKRGTMG